MSKPFNPKSNYEATQKSIGYTPRSKATNKTYKDLGFKCGLEIHQQLKTEKKLFCRCPSGQYQKADDYDAEVIRHMRPTLSELGEYDGTALMEFRTRKTIIYHLKNENACTYEIDDTPPFSINKEALAHAMEIALLLKTRIVGELHITRKQYLDGSIPTGFQRTTIMGIEGEIPITGKPVRIKQLSVEEDSCREVSDIGHIRTYRTDRLGMPLIETVTYPDLLTPEEAAEAAQYLRFLARSTGKVNTGIGAARQDVNVSVTGGTRVEIKGVAHIRWIPELVHNEAYRQKALLEIQKKLKVKISDSERWKLERKKVASNTLQNHYPISQNCRNKGHKMIALQLQGFKSILSAFTQPGRTFADEIADRLKVVACIDKPNLTHTESLNPWLKDNDWDTIINLFDQKDDDAFILLWGPEEDINTAVETVEERCRLAFDGVPNETRKALKNGNTLFERVLPGPDRMYPDTDSPPIPVSETDIEAARKNLPSDIASRKKQLEKWKVPADTYEYLLSKNLFSVLDEIVSTLKFKPVFSSVIIGQLFKSLEGRITPPSPFPIARLVDLFRFVKEKELNPEILKDMLPVAYTSPNMDFNSVLTTINFKYMAEKDILAHLPDLKTKYREIRTSPDPGAESRWVMGHLRPLALGNMDLKILREKVDKDPS